MKRRPWAPEGNERRRPAPVEKKRGYVDAHGRLLVAVLNKALGRQVAGPGL
jgi:hypothetical protein